MDGAKGPLPNDRRHQFKVYGNYQLTNNLLLGFNALLQSGRPINAFGTGHPNGTPDYGDTYYLTDPSTGELRFSPRGSAGRTDWVARFDVSAMYSTEVYGGVLELRAEVFNLFNGESATEVYEDAELSPGVTDPAVGINQEYQQPRTVRFGVSYRF